MDVSNTTLMLHLPPRILNVSRKVIEALGHRVLVARRAHDAMRLVEDQPIEMFIFCIEDPNKDCVLFDRIRRKQPHCQGIALLSPSLKGNFPLLKTRFYPDHLIPEKSPREAPDLAVTIKKVLTGDIFGMEKYDVIPEKSLLLSRSGDKKQTIRLVRRFFQERGVPNDLLHRVTIALDEMIMNAVFDAPRSAKGRRLYYHRPRSALINLPPEERPEIVYGMNNTNLAFSVTDRFGAFGKKTFFSFINRLRISRAIHPGNGKGAGMGLYLIFRALDEMIINVHPGKKSEFIGLIHLHKSRNVQRYRRRAFHFFHME